MLCTVLVATLARYKHRVLTFALVVSEKRLTVQTKRSRRAGLFRCRVFELVAFGFHDPEELHNHQRFAGSKGVKELAHESTSRAVCAIDREAMEAIGN